MLELTDRQYEIYRYIRTFIVTNKFPPTIREISDKTEITPKGAFDHVKALKNKGWITYSEGLSRSIVLCERDFYKYGEI